MNIELDPRVADEIAREQLNPEHPRFNPSRTPRDGLKCGADGAERVHARRSDTPPVQGAGRAAVEPENAGAFVDRSGTLWVRTEQPTDATARLARALGRLAAQGLRTYPEDAEYLQNALAEHASPGMILGYLETLAWFLGNDPGERVVQAADAEPDADDGER